MNYVFIIEQYTPRAYAIIKAAKPKARIICLFEENEIYKVNKLSFSKRLHEKLPEHFNVKISGKKTKKVDFSVNLKNDTTIFACGINVIRAVNNNWDAKLNTFRRSGNSIYNVSNPLQKTDFLSDLETTNIELFPKNLNEFAGQEDFIVLDIETTGFYPWQSNSKIISISLSDGTKDIYVGSFKDLNNINHKFKDKKLIGHNLKFDLMWLKYFGIDLTSHVLYDTMVAEHLINENLDKGLDDLVFRYTNLRNYWKNINYNNLEKDLDSTYLYNACDIYATRAVWQEQKKLKFSRELFSFEMNKLKALLDVQLNGMLVNRGLLAVKTAEARRIAKKAFEHIKLEMPDLNINSGPQLRTYFYETKGYPVSFKTDKGNPAVNADAIDKISKDYPDDIVAREIGILRSNMKLVKTYYTNIFNNLDSKGFLHGNFNQASVVTGRLSSSGGVNFQNIPARDASAVESLFESRFPGGSICKFDYSQMELRLLADLSKDKAMLKAFNSGEDFHTATAKALGIDRQAAKTTNFRIVYGGGSEAEKENWFKAYPEAKAWVDKTIGEWRRRGISESPLGRTRHIQYSNKDSWNEQRHKERQSFNSIIQGMASDLTLIGLVLLHKCKDLNYVLINTIHDSILADIPELSGSEDSRIHYIKDVLENDVPKAVEKWFGYKLTVPLKVDCSFGKSWGSCK